MKRRVVYLDHAAATPVAKPVLAVMQPFFSEQFYNPSALYLSAKAVRGKLEEARQTVAKTIGCQPAEIVFTAGGSEADNLAIHGILSQFADGEVIISAIEHDAIWQASIKHLHKVLPVNNKGSIEFQKLTELITDKTVLVSIMLVSNEVGTIQPLAEATKIIADVKRDRQKRGVNRPLYLHTDASQAGNYLDLHVKRLGVDLMTLNGGKIYGPKQSGCLFVRAGIPLQPIIDGGGQEWGLRSGTESLAQAVGFATALDKAQKNRTKNAKQVEKLRDQLWRGIQKIAPKAERLGQPNQQIVNVLSVRFPGIDNERLVMEFDELGVQAAVGSACKAASGEISRTLLAMGLDAEQAGEAVRFSLGALNSSADIDYTIKALARLLSR